jgi:tRNA-splicing ligase RtcB
MMVPKIAQWGIVLPDRELACAPFKSTEGQDYFKAMAAAANFAWANRQVIGYRVRTVFQKMFGESTQVNVLYDVSHNIGKIEQHMINGKQKMVLVHRKGATRAFGPDNSAIPVKYRQVGQPVLIPGTMGTASYVLAGTHDAMNVSFGSACHGAGRRMSRMAALRAVKGPDLRRQLEHQGIVICCRSNKGLAEEAPIAYKEIDNVVNIVAAIGVAKKVARLKPIAVIKG